MMEGSSNARMKAKEYQRDRVRLHLAGLFVSALFLILYQLTGASVAVRDWALGVSGGLFYPALAAYFLVFSATQYLITLPLDLYGGYIHERRFGLSNQTLARWCAEEAKKAILSCAISLVLVEALYAICWVFPIWWWAIASIFWLAFTVGFAKIFPVLILPIFYRYSPLADDELRARVFAMAKKFRIALAEVSQIDFSKNTKKSNAAVIGWGSSRRVILADNLVKEFSRDEVEVVVAHEMAHYAYGHIQRLIAVQTISTIIIFYLLDRVLPACAHALGLAGAFDMALFPVIMLFFSVTGLILSPFLHAYSRALERAADRGALDTTGKKEAFISMMKKLAEKNLSDDDPPMLVEYLFYDHPPISKRIRMAESGHFFRPKGPEWLDVSGKRPNLSEMPDHPGPLAPDKNAK